MSNGIKHKGLSLIIISSIKNTLYLLFLNIIIISRLQKKLQKFKLDNLERFVKNQWRSLSQMVICKVVIHKITSNKIFFLQVNQTFNNCIDINDYKTYNIYKIRTTKKLTLSTCFVSLFYNVYMSIKRHKV